MSASDPIKKRSSRKLTKKPSDRRAPTFDIPERFKDGPDCQEDVTAPKGKNAQYMNQSVFSMIAAAGSKTDFHARFDDSSSDSDDGDGPESPRPDRAQRAPADGASDGRDKSRGHSQSRRRSPMPALLKSLPRLHPRSASQKRIRLDGSRSGSQSPRPGPGRSMSTEMGASLAPVMSRMLEAEAQLHSSDLEAGPHDDEDSSREDIRERAETSGFTSLAVRLMEIFEFDEPEDVLSEYPCWLLKSVLLQGYMYITNKHICFYAYLPKKSNVVAKSGYLSKRGRQNPKYNRYWFTLKGDVLSYFADPSNLYFPSGNIDLRYGISAALTESKEKGKPSSNFTVTTHQRVYYFKADSAASAKEWVRTLQKVIFRSHNDGDSVKVSLPIENIIDIEDSTVLEFAETVKIRVVDNDETYAIDEYFFSFFSFGREARDLLKMLIDDSPAQRLSTHMFTGTPGHDGTISPREAAPGEALPGNITGDRLSRSPLGVSTPVFRDSVKATLSPLSPTDSGRASPRASFDVARGSFDVSRRSLDLSQALQRASFDRGRRGTSIARKDTSQDQSEEKSPSPRKPHDSTDESFVHSLDREPESITGLDSSDGTHVSASQILDRSDVFQSPTIQHLQRQDAAGHAHSDLEDPRRHSEEFRRPSPAEIRVHAPTRSQTQRSGPTQLARQSVDSKRHAERKARHGHGQESSASTPTLQELVKVGAYPLQRAAGFAGYLKNRSKRMSNLLATESMGYIEKVSGMWQGGRRHYHDSPGVMSDELMDDAEDEADDTAGHGERFRAHFAFHPTEKLQATYFGYLHRVLPLYGKIYISNRSFCFRSLLPGTRTKLVLPLKDIENVDKEKGFRFAYSGLVVVIRGFEELFFEFRLADTRDDCAVTLLQNLESLRYLQESGVLSREEKDSVDAAKAENQKLQEARQEGHDEHDLTLPQSTEETPHPTEAPPILFDDPRASIINFKPTESLRITCLTIGSRGDVQPYIALCKGLIAEGHKPKIATHAEFEPWVRKHGIEFASVDGDPAELMRICVENGMFTYSFIREASLKFRGWIDELLSSAWKACQDTDILIESPSAMAGIHIAEALAIPYFRAFTMPWTRTRAYPHAFAVPEHKMGGAYNYFTYVMFDNVFWKAIAGQVNRWRKKELGLPRTNLDKMQPNKVPFLYNFSPHVVVPPIDYSDWIRVTGYWFLDEAVDWEPPKDLTDFIGAARADDKKLVYVGFGSIVVSDPAALTKTIIDSVLKADVRCILSKGWSDRLGSKDATDPEVPLPDSIFQIKSAPHDWLFQQIDAAAHHGGAGTTGASLRAGLPTIIKPFFGDQFFFGSRVEDLGVGICVKKLNVSVFSRALWECTHSERMITKAKVLGEAIRQEDGVGTAIQAIYRDLEYAKTLIKKIGHNAEEGLEESEESWTFIGDESDPELVRRIAEWEPMVQMGPDHEGPPQSKLNLFSRKGHRGVSPSSPARVSSEHPRP